MFCGPGSLAASAGVTRSGPEFGSAVRMCSGSVVSSRGSRLAGGGVPQGGGHSQRPAGSAARILWPGLCHVLPRDRPGLKELGRKAPFSMGGICAVCGPLESKAGSRPYCPLNASSQREAAVGCDFTSWSLKSAGGFESCRHLPGAPWSWEAIQSCCGFPSMRGL